MHFYTLRLATALDAEAGQIEEIDAIDYHVAAMFAEDIIRLMRAGMPWQCAVLANAKGETVWR